MVVFATVAGPTGFALTAPASSLVEAARADAPHVYAPIDCVSWTVAASDVTWLAFANNPGTHSLRQVVFRF